MKKLLNLMILLIILAVSCEKNDNYSSLDGFNIVMNNQVVLSHNDIDYYDFSTHMIYLKDENSFASEITSRDTFYVYANRQKIYRGDIIPNFSSYMPSEPYITDPFFYSHNILPINFMHAFDESGKPMNEDPRGDERIIAALKKYGQYHSGLECEIKSVSYISNTDVSVEIEIYNPDSYNYYIMDPDKMGIGSYHYFTNGLYITHLEPHAIYYNDIVTGNPGSWKMEWLSLLKAKERKSFTINYNKFDNVPPGKYIAHFQFFGLNVTKENLVQADGRIWQGEITTDFQFEVK